MTTSTTTEKRHKKDLTVLVFLGVASAMMFAGLWALEARSRVVLINALPAAVVLEIDGNPQQLIKNARDEVSLATGAHTFRVSALDGTVLSEDVYVVPPRQDVVLYNVMGACPLVYAAIVYSPRGSSGDAEPPKPRMLAGEKFVALKRVDYEFAPPPQSISVDSKSGAITKWYLDQDEGGWRTAAHHTSIAGRTQAAMELSQAVARVNPKEPDSAGSATVQTSRAHGHEAARKFVAQLAATNPQDPELQSLLIGQMRRQGRHQALHALAEERVRQSPDDDGAKLFLARTETMERSLAIRLDLLRRNVEVLEARRGAVALLQDLHRDAEALPHLEAMASTDPDYQDFLSWHVSSLLAVGRGWDAVSLVMGTINAAEKPAWRLVVLLANTLHVAGVKKDVPDVENVLKKVTTDDQEGLRAYIRSLTGGALDGAVVARLPEALNRAVRLHVAASRQPAEAWQLTQNVQPGMLEQVDRTTALLLAAEFDRAGDFGTAASLYALTDHVPLPLEAIRAYVLEGRQHPEHWRLYDEQRAALDLVRARQVDADGGDASKLYADLRKRRVLHGVVARAIATWPRPASSLATWVALRRKTG